MDHSPEIILSVLNKMNKNNLVEMLSIEFIHMDLKTLTASMPVNSRVHQSFGLLHGGASVVLAETVGSSLSEVHVDIEKYKVLGMQISANHLKSMQEGILYAKASFLRRGHSTHLVKIELYDEQKQRICFSLLTNFIQKK